MNGRKFGLGAVVVLIAASSVFRVVLEAGRQSWQWVDLLTSLPWLLQPLVFGVAGVVIMWKRPGNMVGRLLLLPALAWVLDPLVVLRLTSVDPNAVRFDLNLYLAVLVDNLSWLVVVFPVFHLLFVYPTGRLLGRGWRWLVGIEVVMIGLLVGLALGSEVIGPIAENGRGDWTVEVPFGFISADVFESAWFTIGWPIGLVTLAVAGVVATTVRYRRADPIERHQIKWLFAAAGLFASVYVASAALGDGDNANLEAVLGLALAAIPVAVMVAVLRYRLFEIDRLLSRTLTYALAAGLVAMVYGLTIIGLTAVLPVSASDLAVAASTLAAFAALGPVRRTTQSWVERRFDRTRYDAARTVEHVASRLRDRLDLDTVATVLAATVRDVLQPEQVSVWLVQSASNERPALTP